MRTRVRTLAALERIFRGEGSAAFAVELWDGTTWAPDPGREPLFLLRLRHPGALRAMLWPPGELGLGQAFVRGDFDIEGDVEAAVRIGQELFGRGVGVGERLAQVAALLRLPRGNGATLGRRPPDLAGRRHSRSRDRAAVTYHYDLPPEFFRLFLGPTMAYSCAFFATEDEDVDSAQERKLDYACRKLRLRPGERLLDIGCGWGSLVVQAVERYGVEAVGITLSAPQAEVARRELEARGLWGRGRVEVRDYRELPDAESYDKIVSVGMFEHVGAKLLPDYFARAWRLLRPGGVFLNHGIARSPGAPTPRLPTFVSRYVFPDGELVPLAMALAAAGEAGFEVRDVESLREHYALTLRAWVHRLEARREEAVASAGEAAYRIWRLYMAGSAHAFASERLNVYQVLLAKPVAGASGLPLTRGDWYA